MPPQSKVLSSAGPIVTALAQIKDLVHQSLVAEVNAVAEFDGPVQMSRAFVVLRILKDKIEETFKEFDQLYDRAKNEMVPAVFEKAGVPSINLDEGYRITVSHSTRASTKQGEKERAIEWLRANGLQDIVTETIAASTLSAVARDMAEENMELPSDIFNVFVQPNTSVTKTK